MTDDFIAVIASQQNPAKLDFAERSNPEWTFNKNRLDCFVATRTTLRAAGGSSQ